MRILSIETSCDETAISLLEISGPLEKPEVKVLGNSLFSQIHLHAEYGGVYPNLAKREHEKNLPIMLKKTLTEAEEDLDNPSIDFLAVTEGPGLEPALWTGITFAQELSQKWDKPLVPVNHMAGHIYSVLSNLDKPLEFPALSLLVSGGHTELVLIKDFGVYEILGQTRDDAVGEAFDKVARLLGLPYPGGPKISALAELDRANHEHPSFKFPRPMLHSPDLDFSYSGLKTAVLYKVKDRDLSEKEKTGIARAFEDAAIEVLMTKSRKALEKYPEVKTFITAGGVAANNYLRTELGKLSDDFANITFLIPEKSLTTDNAIMIALAAYISISHPSKPHELRAQGNLSLSNN